MRVLFLDFDGRTPRRAEGRMSADERWRTTNGPYPVLLCMPGMDYSMTVGQAMSLLRTAPRLAGRWTPPHGSPAGCGAMRSDAQGTCIAVVFGEQWPLGTHAWASYDEPTTRGHARTRQDAMDAADAALRAAGWLLEEG